MIELSGVSYRYPEASSYALRSIDLLIEGGDFLLVAGPSGGGKSTLLRTMNGLIPHFHGGSFGGKVSVDGVSTLDARPRDFTESVGFVGQRPESHAVVDQVEDDIAFTLENLGLDHKGMRKRVEEALDALGIANLRARKLNTLSGGERQKAAIASVIAAMPRYLILDEPTSQLDPRSAEEVLSALLNLRDEVGVAIVLAEHRLERVIQHCDDVCLVAEGRIDSGPTDAILTRSDIGPPIVHLGRAFGWHPLPRRLKDARRLAAALSPASADPPDIPVAGATVANVKGLRVSHGANRVLTGIDLDIREGEVLALMGRNGSGKTTMLRALAGVQPYTGTAQVTTPLAFVPQDPDRILFRRTVGDELAATLKGRRRPADRQAVMEQAEEFGVAHLIDKHPRDLSGGERTKAALAAACCGEVSLFLLDEPTRGMDDASKNHLAASVERWRKDGKAVIVATHDVELAARIATRVVLLSEGQIVVDAPPHEALAGSLTFSTQMNKVFNSPAILTVDQAIAASR